MESVLVIGKCADIW